MRKWMMHDELLEDAPGRTRLTVRTLNALKNANVHAIGQLASLPVNNFLAIKGLGEAGWRDIQSYLRAYEVHWR